MSSKKRVTAESEVLWPIRERSLQGEGTISLRTSEIVTKTVADCQGLRNSKPAGRSDRRREILASTLRIRTSVKRQVISRQLQGEISLFAPSYPKHLGLAESLYRTAAFSEHRAQTASVIMLP